MSVEEREGADEIAVKDIPPIPIKTYQWEDVRRSKVKGEYPWTHLSKEPFDPNNMETQTIAMGTTAEEPVKDTKMDLDSSELEQKETQIDPDEITVLEDTATTNGVTEEPPKQELKSALKSTFRETEVALKSEPEAGPSKDRLKRAKSEEGGKRKRKLSIDSSYSRVSKYSLTKLGAVKKKVKEATDLTRSLIKLPRNPFSKSRSKLNKADKSKDDKPESTKSPKSTEEQTPVVVKSEPVAKKSSTSGQPVYIHIPLKPPAGETDEFSHLEFEETVESPRKKEPSPIKEEELESPVDTPKSVQLIILTAPSDDEILDDVTIPETPSEGDNFFDNHKLEELKTFAKNVADRISPETKRRNISIEEVDEEKVMEVAQVEVVDTPKDVIEKEVQADKVEIVEKEVEKVKPAEVKAKKVKKVTKTKKEKQTKVDPKIEDEEDGLKTSETIAKEIIEAEIKEEAAAIVQDEASSANQDEEHPICKLKKTVSFKRRSGDKDDDYEDIANPDDLNKDKVLTAVVDIEPIKEDVVLDLRERGKLEAAQSQSMTVEEEKTYLDAKIMKDTSLDEDCSKWSKEIDHEYEPVNPPADTPTEQPKSSPTTPVTPTTPTSSNYDFNQSPPIETNLSKTPVHISTSSLERLASKLAEMDLARTGIQSGRQSRTGSPNGTEKHESHAAKLQEALKVQAEKFKTRVKSIKRPKMPKAPTMPKMPKMPKMSKKPSVSTPKKPTLTLPKKPSITLPKRPNIHMPKINKPNMSMPKMPDSIKNINFSSLSLPKRKSASQSRQLTTADESTSTAAPSKKFFDFSTYPRIFSRKPKQDVDQSLGTTTKSDFDSRKTTSKSDYDSRKSKDSEPSSVRIPLHSAESIEREGYDREDSVERRMRSSHMQYEDDIDIEDAYMRENQEIHTTAEQHNRWTHGSFHHQPNEYYNDNNNEDTINDNDKSESAADSTTKIAPARGVLEEINQDEFFLRQKGISQDNIEVGAYLSSEIREAFKKPTSTSSQIERVENEAYYDQNFDRASNKSLPETPKRKAVKKPSRRKKTPHVSAEAIQQAYMQQQEVEIDLQLQQPERPSRKQRIQKQYDSYEMDLTDNTDNLDSNILGMDEYRFTDKQFSDMYENEIMAGMEQPNIIVSDLYNGRPSTAPRRRNKSQRSQESEQDSSLIIDGMGMGGYESILQRDDISLDQENTTAKAAAEPPIRPIRTRSRTRSKSRPGEEMETKTDSAASLAHNGSEQPCVEEPFVKDSCDNMGYSVITKHRSRAMDKSHLPPPAPRRKQKKDKFSTVPRKLDDDSPSRPQRNYSTLVPNRPPRRTSQPNLTDEEKGVDISQYIEVESEDHNRDLHSGEVIQKMKDRPLPAPPRPPRQPLRKSQTPRPDEEGVVIEVDVSVQTEPLPDHYVIEDMEHDQIEERRDRVDCPNNEEEVDDVIIAKKATPKPKYRHDFDHEETVTHGSLLVQPFTLEDGTEPQEFFSRSSEKFITVRKDYVDDLDSEIPEEFMHFRSPGEEHIVTIPQIIERIIERPVQMQPDFSSEIELLKAHKLQVGDLDVDNLRVNELQASKITVTNIDSSSIEAQELSSRGGNLVVGGIELPPSFLQQLLDTIKIANERQEQARVDAAAAKDDEEEADSGQKKTSIEQVGAAIEAGLPKRPPRHQLEPERGRLSRTTSKEADTNTTHVDSSETQQEQTHVYEDIASPQQLIEPRVPSPTSEHLVSDRLSPETVQRFKDYSIDEASPPREDSLSRGDDAPLKIERKHKRTILEEVPPPIPPQPHLYQPSNPPAGFYNLRAAPEFIDEDLPTPPHSPTRRRRPQHHHHHKIVQLPPESSTDDMTPPISRSSRRSRTPEPSIPELTVQLGSACAHSVERTVRRVLMYFTNSVMSNTDGKQDLHVVVVILLVLLAGLILLGWGDSHDVHHHHWEYFNPPKDI